MTFYVRRAPGPCDPRSTIMGHVKLNGIQTPPARIWFEDRGPGTPVSRWTYNGPLGAFSPLPEIFVPFVTPACTPRFVIWAVGQVINIGGMAHLLQITIAKLERSIATIDDWDSYWIRLGIDGVQADEFVEHRQLSEFGYSRYQNNTPGQPWLWTNGGAPFQAVSWTEAWPLAFDRTTPGPPFVPGL